MKFKIFFIFTALLLSLNLQAKNINISYDKPKNKADRDIKKLIQDSKVNEDFAIFVDQTFKISKDINIVYGYNQGPQYDPSSNTIAISYDFIDEMYYRFEKKHKGDVTNKVFDSLLHTLLHEFAHAFIFVENIPVVGKEEDAADGLANIMILESFENGADITLNAAELFLLESKDRPNHTKEDYWDEHSLDIQRYYSTMCYIYGSAPEKYESLARNLGYDDYRKNFCEGDYANLYTSWMDLLTPFFKLNELEVTKQ